MQLKKIKALIQNNVRLFINRHSVKYWQRKYNEANECYERLVGYNRQMVERKHELENEQDILLIYQKRYVKSVSEKREMQIKINELEDAFNYEKKEVERLNKIIENQQEKIALIDDRNKSMCKICDGLETGVCKDCTERKITVTESDTLPPEAALSEMNKDPVTAAGASVIDEEKEGDSVGEGNQLNEQNEQN